MTSRIAAVAIAAAATVASTIGVSADTTAHAHDVPPHSRRTQEIIGAATIAPAEAPSTPICSCAPRTYDFRINYNGNCNTDTIAGSPGIDGTICFYTKGGDPDAVNEGEVSLIPGSSRRRGLLRNGNNNVITDFVDGGKKKRDGHSYNHNENEKWERLLSKTSFATHHEHAAMASSSSQQHGEVITRSTQSLDPKPVTITSASFIEFDTSSDLNIINQDSTYFGTTLANGAVISYPSISNQLDLETPVEEQLDLLPGGVMVVLFGLNAQNVMVQNTIAWGYNVDSCASEPLQEGDRISWISLVDYQTPKAEVCDAVTNMPTVNPTLSPTVTSKPTPEATYKKSEMTNYPSMAPTEGATIPTHSPTMRATKAQKSSKSTKSGKSDSSYSYDYDSEDGKYQLFSKGSKNKDKPYQLFAKGAKNGVGDDTIMDDAGYQLFGKSEHSRSKTSKKTGSSSSGGSYVTVISSGKSGKASSGSSDVIFGQATSAKATKLFKQPIVHASGKSSKMEEMASSTKSAKAMSFDMNEHTPSSKSLKLASSEDHMATKTTAAKATKIFKKPLMTKAAKKESSDDGYTGLSSDGSSKSAKSLSYPTDVDSKAKKAGTISSSSAKSAKRSSAKSEKAASAATPGSIQMSRPPVSYPSRPERPPSPTVIITRQPVASNMPTMEMSRLGEAVLEDLTVEPTPSPVSPFPTATMVNGTVANGTLSPSVTPTSSSPTESPVTPSPTPSPVTPSPTVSSSVTPTLSLEILSPAAAVKTLSPATVDVVTVSSNTRPPVTRTVTRPPQGAAASTEDI